MTQNNQACYQNDLDQTQVNRERLRKNHNLLLWYRTLYRDLFQSVPDITDRCVLEIGSGTSPLKLFLPKVITSDILKLDYLDIIFDCHEIARCEAIPDHSLDIVTLTNVLHHLHNPLQFLIQVTKKLTKGGHVFIVEPYFSLISYPIYKFLHPEPVKFSITQPILEDVQGPLSSANQAMPYMIFFSRPDWLAMLANYYELDETRFGFFTSLAYMMTGGISKIFPIPEWVYRPYLWLDRFLAKALPRLFASFFTVRLTTKRGP